MEVPVVSVLPVRFIILLMQGLFNVGKYNVCYLRRCRPGICYCLKLDITYITEAVHGNHLPKQK